MKSLLVLLFAAAFASVPALAQTSGPAPAPGSSVAPAAAATATPAPAVASPASAGNTHEAASTVPLPGQSTGPTLEKNIPLIPETAPAGAETASHRHGARPGGTPHDTFGVEKDIRVRVHLRLAQTRALKSDPGIEAEWTAAHAASTDPERRKLLALYYNHLYDRMAKIDPTIATEAANRKSIAIERMKYTRLGDLDNSEDPFVAPTPEPSGPNPPATEAPTSQ